MVLDTILNKVDFNFEIKDNQKYNINILPGAIEDFFGEKNDTLKFGPGTGSYADLGDLALNLSGDVKYPLIVELVDKNGVKLKEIYATKPQLFEFNYLKPGDYSFRVIFDANGNGKWDTGSFLNKIQPEAVKYYPDFVNVRALSTYNETFIISE